MNARSSFLVLLLLGASGIASAAPKSEASKPPTEDRVRLLLDLTGAEALGRQALDAELSRMPDAAYAARFKAEARKDDLLSRLIPVYIDHLSAADVEGAIAFYQSPAGRHMVMAQPLIAQDTNAIAAKWGQEIDARVRAAAPATPAPH